MKDEKVKHVRKTPKKYPEQATKQKEPRLVQKWQPELDARYRPDSQHENPENQKYPRTKH